MKKILLYTFLLIVSIKTANAEIPSHCAKGEVTLLTAQMGKVVNGGFKSNEKILSLCVDGKKEPFNKLSYRYGKLGAVEMEQVATSQDRFFLHFKQTTPKTSDNAIWFLKGNTAYVVNECMGMCNGIYLYVFQGGKKIAELVSPDEQTYDSNINVDYEKSMSPIFQTKNLQFNLN